MDSPPDLSRRKFILGSGIALGTAGTLGIGAGSDLEDISNLPQITDDNEQDTIGACSFNIRYDNPEDDYPWENRLSRVVEAIDQLDPALLGVQEAQPNQFKDLQRTVTGYDWYGVGRKGGNKGEFVPIAWVKDRFEVLDKGAFWLSPTPDVPSIGWGAENPRVSTWASLHDSQTDTELWFCNTHFSHVDATARVESARIIRERAAQRASDGATVVITGDINATPISHAYHVIAQEIGAGGESPVADGRREADTTTVFGPWGTFHGFTGDIEDRIDYVFTPKSSSVEWYRTLGIREGGYRSDHLPVMAMFEP